MSAERGFRAPARLRSAQLIRRAFRLESSRELQGSNGNDGMPPDWLRDLVEKLTACVEPVDAGAPIGCHVCQADGIWEITLFVSRTEVFGGEFDGQQFPGRFVLNVGELLSRFDEVDACWWQPLKGDASDDLGPHLSIEGQHCGESVWVRITARQPAPIESGCVANALTGQIERRW